ncbi:MAG: hypothetical protein IIC50_22895 [Planctomycetes bacterium]|nr:hypothetical protein [Planctomycetota bacterium]
MTRQVFLKAMVTAVAVFGLLVFPSVLTAQGNSASAFARVKEVQERNTDKLLARNGVVGTAIGLSQGGQPVMLVLLEVAGVPTIPDSLEGVQLRPLVIGKIYAVAKPAGKGGGKGGGGGGEDPPLDPTSRWPRAVPIGVSTGHPSITAGTLGCRLTDGINVYALSNNHVYANKNLASIGDPVIQPGTFDGGSTPGDTIGTLFGFAPINFSGGDNTIDAAIAVSSTALLGNATPSDGYGRPKIKTVSPYINQKVKKYGRTTGLTKGQVVALNAVVNVNYSYESGWVARFVNQIIISPGSFSAPGDSGSLVVADGKGKDRADDRRPVGLLFAGSSLYTIANPMDAVLARFVGLTVDGD